MDIRELEASLSTDPHDPATLINLGKLYLNTGRIIDAIPLLTTAAELWPHIFLAENYLGDAYCLAMQPHTAIEHYERALLLRPGDSDVLTNLSVCHWHIGDFDSAYRYGKLVRQEQPVNFGMLSLLMGDYEEGWKHWEFLDTALSIDGLPQWEGEDIHDKHVLVLDEEQGFGDTIMMARFLPMLSDKCRALTFQTRPPLLRLMKSSFPHVNIVTEVRDAVQFDVQVRVFSLPRLFQARPDTIPNRPYLRSAEDDCTCWRSLLAHCHGLKVGLRWSGSPTHPMESIRTINDLSVLAPLRDISGVTYVSLAKEKCAMPDLPMLDFNEQLIDFAETAALIAALDLVISVDTGVLNLSGAIGAKTWLLDRLGTDWRWGTKEDHSPWYPSVRIFRQPTMGDWASVVTRIEAELRSLTRRSHRRAPSARG